eukprot:CAMPEP_0201719688 /NCGR_PEP_ID=MMETSP0593-20130828/4844_1 /ASSEMBLY_ACC=CAM_ASM_000672 /TAXON_ID=267983 /ORGANISM="Skeletonema japonicum, Strain CCMP2506" /LENGTH=794 /DNA_ID=CAMNT_0048210195 /DNA_START=62 /DNA_END=2446 /DNA_ORIENTATION=+
MKQRYGSTSRENDEHKSLLDVDHCDHYDDDNDSYNNRKHKSASASSNNNSNSSERSCWRSIANCLILPLFLTAAASAAFSYYLQTKITTLSSQLYSLDSNVQQLSSELSIQHHQLTHVNETLANHSTVIARFEHSVSNSDVLQKLQQLEQDSQRRQDEIDSNLNTTKSEIETTLAQTQRDINATLEYAQNTINTQVNSVQATLSSYIRTTQDQFSTENSFMVYQLAGTFTLLGCLISMWHMTSHLRNFQQPFVQRKILAILWMCPIYSVTSWLSLVIPAMEGYLAILKDLYEAYVIYQFLSFLIAVLGKGNREAVVDLLARHADHLSPPVRCFGCCRNRLGHGIVCSDEKRQLADDVLLQCQVCAMQFVFLRPLLTAVQFALKQMDYHGPLFGPGNPFDRTSGDGGGGGDLDMDADSDLCSYIGGGMIAYCTPQFWLIFMENISVFLAFSGLLNFYHAVSEGLSWCRPFPKFLCIKGVVFMTFWQGLVISLLAESTDILSSGGEAVTDGNAEDQETYAKQAQNFLICLEMLGFAIAHFYCFPVEEWEEGYRPVEDRTKFGDNMALGDFLHDLKLIMRHKSKKKKNKSKDQLGNSNSVDTFSTVPEEDEEIGALLDNVKDLLLEDDSPAPSPIKTSKGSIMPEPDDDDSPTKEAQKVATPKVESPGNEVDEESHGEDLPSELRAARALLLESRLLDETTASLLTRDMLDHISNEREADDDSDHGLDERITDDGHNVEISDEENQYHPASDTHEDVDEEEEEAHVAAESSLLFSTSPSDQVLQPSIFTMHSKSLED